MRVEPSIRTSHLMFAGVGQHHNIEIRHTEYIDLLILDDNCVLQSTNGVFYVVQTKLYAIQAISCLLHIPHAQHRQNQVSGVRAVNISHLQTLCNVDFN